MTKLASPRVLIAGLFHETHTFLPDVTPLSRFSILRADELFDSEGDVSPFGGALEIARALNWELVPALDIRAIPSSIVADEVVEFWWQACREVLCSALEEGLDGIYLVLHGAMVAQSFPDVEGEILERIRGVAGYEVPLCGVTDLHANFSPRMARCSNGLLTYRCNPHSDARETAVRAAHLLDSLMASKELGHSLPRTFFSQVPVVWPPTGTGTNDTPMSELELLARTIESETADVLAVNVHAGYAFADVEDAGVSFTINAPPEAAPVAEKALERLSSLALEHREVGNVIDADFDTLLPELQNVLQEPGAGPVVIAEPADNIGGGAPGDGTALLRRFIGHQLGQSAVVICDATAVACLGKVEIGATLTLTLGGASRFPGAGPLELEIELLSRSDGEYDLEDVHSHMASGGGLHIQMGVCATVRHALPNGQSVFILLTSLPSAPFDLGQLRSQGIEPKSLALIGAKAAVAHRQAYAPIARVLLSVETPGPCTSNLKELPYKQIRRPIFPLDDEEHFDC